MIISRAFLYNYEGKEFLFIAPILDLVNYDPTYISDFSAGYKISENGDLFINAERDFLKNEEFL